MTPGSLGLVRVDTAKNGLLSPLESLIVASQGRNASIPVLPEAQRPMLERNQQPGVTSALSTLDIDAGAGATGQRGYQRRGAPGPGQRAIVLLPERALKPSVSVQAGPDGLWVTLNRAGELFLLNDTDGEITWISLGRFEAGDHPLSVGEVPRRGALLLDSGGRKSSLTVDIVSLGTSESDDFHYSSAQDFLSANAVVDLIDGGPGENVVSLKDAINITEHDDLRRMFRVQTLRLLGSGKNQIVLANDEFLSDLRIIDMSQAGDPGAESHVVELQGITKQMEVIGSSFADHIVHQGNAVRLTGGTGVDTFDIRSGSAVITDLGNGGDADVITIANGASVVATVANPSGFIASPNVGNINNGSLTVEASADVVTGSTISLGSFEGDRGATLVGNDNGLTLIGTPGNDIIIGGDGNDLIIGGSGADRMTGGGGVNTYQYGGFRETTAGIIGVGILLPSWTLTGIDVITDAKPGDQISYLVDAMRDFGDPSLTGYTSTGGSAAQGVMVNTVSTAGFIDNGVSLIRGTWNDESRVFTRDGSGESTLFAIDLNVRVNSGTMNSIIFENSVITGASLQVNNGGVMVTLA